MELHNKPDQRIKYHLLWLIVGSFVLAWLTTQLMHNTIHYQTISDAERYVQQFRQNQVERPGVLVFSPLTWGSTDDFITKSNFVIILLIGYLMYDATKSWKITLLALLGFSVSLMLYFSLLAQALVVIVGLFLWTKIEPKGWGHLVFLLCAIFMLFTHKFGLPLAIIIYLIKLAKKETSIEIVAITNYIVGGAILFIQLFPNIERVSFFYYFLLPISLGGFDLIYWYAIFGVLLWMVMKTKNNQRTLLLMSSCFMATAVNYEFFSTLEIDFWRILIIAELVALVQIGKEGESKWLPIVLLLMGAERLILGII